jgi:hypothetical protein
VSAELVDPLCGVSKISAVETEEVVSKLCMGGRVAISGTGMAERGAKLSLVCVFAADFFRLGCAQLVQRAEWKRLAYLIFDRICESSLFGCTRRC